MVKKKTAEVEKKEVKKKENNDIDALKKELTNYIDESVKKSINLELEKSYKRTIRDKSIKIIIKNMVITVLLLVIVYLVYVLNENDYFDKFFIEESTRSKEVIKQDDIKEEESKKEEEKKEPTLDELKEKYAYLLDNIYINEDSTYLEDYYNGNLTDGLKSYLTMNLMDIDDLSKEENYNVIENDIFKKCYEKKFIGDYKSKNFNYNGNTFRYISKLDSYITDEVVKKNTTNIKRMITKISLENDNVIITTVEGLVKEGKIYNILSEEEVSEYSDKLMLEKIDKLNKVIYTFNKDDKLIKISK